MARASSKVILLGEHAVVYDSAAIAAGIGTGATATAVRARAATITINELSARAGDGSEVIAAWDALRSDLGAPNLHATVQLEVPPGCGLGASASIGVAAARAALDVLQPVPGPDEPAPRTDRVVRAALAWERIFHGNPSGIDPWTAALGGCVVFTRQAGARPLELARRLDLVIAIAGPPASTRAMVERVASFRAQHPARAQAALDSIARLVQTARTVLSLGDWVGLGELLNENHRWLATLGVSTPEIDAACDEARAAGALGAKLTGAGGGGAVLALVSHDPAPVLAAWQRRGLQAFATTVAPKSPAQAPRKASP
jgi:mevalonate kinase